MSVPQVYWGRPLPRGVKVRKACLIINPAAGPTKARPDWWVVIDPLREAGWWVTQAQTTGSGSAGQLARQAIADGCKLIVVAGGDGTINEAIQPMVGSDAVLGLIPVGTANILARELGIPPDPAKAGKALVNGCVSHLDLGLVTAPGNVSRYFCEMVGIGFDAAIVAGILPELKVTLGKGAYVLTALQTSFTHRPARVQLIIDGKRLRRLVYMFVISNTRLYGADFLEIIPEANASDGVFHGALFRGQSFWLAWRDFFALTIKRLKELTDVEFFTFRRVEVRSVKPIPYQIDGDLAGTTPITVEIVPHALRVMLPLTKENC
ncbi:MAG: diacylglycerol kinase family lipid kinase [Cyanobacteria bacterium NC_groundwater_1444_Ag_S-0.65um_54_12]|nr:diacylglycerol kinase family lipid kinase [Cyanobacteria bacterium NC_groundwater_1444_Ag_S-0.65um_54_12]